MLLLLGGCAAAQHPQEAPWEPCDVAHGVVVAAATALDAHLVCDARASVLPLAQYLADGLGPAPIPPAPLSDATRARWVSAFSAHAPENDAWRCRGNACIALAPDASVLQELDPVAEFSEEATAWWVLLFDGSCVFDVRLLVSTGRDIDPLDLGVAPEGSDTTQRLRAHVCPGADVFVDGRFVGLAPLELPVAIGERQIMIRYRVGTREVWEQQWRRGIRSDDGFERRIERRSPTCRCAAASSDTHGE